MDGGNCNLAGVYERADYAVKLVEHFGYGRRRMGGDVDPGGETFSVSAEDNDGDVWLGFDLGYCGGQFVHHGDVDYVEWRMVQSDARYRGLLIE